MYFCTGQESSRNPSESKGFSQFSVQVSYVGSVSFAWTIGRYSARIKDLGHHPALTGGLNELPRKHQQRTMQ